MITRQMITYRRSPSKDHFVSINPSRNRLTLFCRVLMRSNSELMSKLNNTAAVSCDYDPVAHNRLINAVIVIPVHRAEPTDAEVISLEQCTQVLGTYST